MVVVPQQYKAKDKSFSFENFYIEYGRFHMDKTNTLIHIVFIPVILTTLMGIMQHYNFGK